MTPSQNERARRTGELKKTVAMFVQTSSGPDKLKAAAQMVPYWAHNVGYCQTDTITSLAEASGIDRSWLSLTLNMKRPGHAVRRALEDYLELSIGGMTDVLSVLEGL